MSEIGKNKKIAIVLLNFGGPNKLDDVKQFLFNLFYDKAVIRLPNPFRWLIAKLIATKRCETSKHIYDQIGGKSPILDWTNKQSDLLKQELSALIKEEFEVFISMRYWYPRAFEVASKIEKYNPTEVIILPLYPHYSTTTTGSGVSDFLKYYPKEVQSICCYPTEHNFIRAWSENIKKSLELLEPEEDFCILFSAHGLPEKIIKQGDPYQWQIEQSVKAIVDTLGIQVDYKVTYQSRVGPVKWIGPCTEEEIKKACLDKKAIVIVPISFVSEHVETLVELDIEYKAIADLSNTKYIRVPALGLNSYYIKALADLVVNKIGNNKMARICPKEFSCCKCS